MKGSHCRLYDENLVRNIMISTGVSIMEFIKKNKSVETEEICEFVEFNADDIIAETIKNLSNDDNDFDNFKNNLDNPSSNSEEEDDRDLLW